VRVGPLLAARHYQPDATRVACPLLRGRHHRPADAQTPSVVSDDERSNQADRSRSVDDRVPGYGKESKRSTGFVNLQERTTAFSEYLAKARRDIARVGRVSELGEQGCNRLSIIVADWAGKGGRSHFKLIE
jgi:hypothetical protein